MPSMPLIFWAPTAAVLAHIFEEFVFPGGFLSWHRRYRPGHASSITIKFALIVNTLLVGLCILIGFIGATPQGAALWLMVAALVFTNAIFHLRGAIAGRSYSPGLITSVLLYLPLAVLGYYFFIRAGLTSIETAIISFLLGGAYPFVSAVLHKQRSYAAKGKEKSGA